MTRSVWRVPPGFGPILASDDFVNQGDANSVLHGNANGDPFWAPAGIVVLLIEDSGGGDDSAFVIPGHPGSPGPQGPTGPAGSTAPSSPGLDGDSDGSEEIWFPPGTLAPDRATVSFVIDGQGSVITTGVKPHLQVMYACTVLEATITCLGAAGTITVKLLKCNYSQFDGGSTHPVAGDDITGASLTISSSGNKFDDTSLSSWTNRLINAADIIAPDITAVTNITQCTITLKVLKI